MLCCFPGVERKTTWYYVTVKRRAYFVCTVKSKKCALFLLSGIACTCALKVGIGGDIFSVIKLMFLHYWNCLKLVKMSWICWDNKISVEKSNVLLPLHPVIHICCFGKYLYIASYIALVVVFIFKKFHQFLLPYGCLPLNSSPNSYNGPVKKAHVNQFLAHLTIVPNYHVRAPEENAIRTQEIHRKNSQAGLKQPSKIQSRIWVFKSIIKWSFYLCGK